MVKYSDDTDYEQIDLATMYELRDARLVKAQIVSIDSVNNSAEITLEEECDELAGKDLSEVPFFYHCEDSTGTLEDLANGHKAFSADEYVYCLWAPASGDIDERFYIIGHVDIRGTKPCASEYLVIGLKGNVSGDTWDTTTEWITVFDVLAGDVLDLVNFENLDSSSPPKPASFPCELDNSVENWLNYNFRNSAPTRTVGCSAADPYFENEVGEITDHGYQESSGLNHCNAWQIYDAPSGYEQSNSWNHTGLSFNTTTNKYDGFRDEQNETIVFPDKIDSWRLVDTTNSNYRVPVLYVSYEMSDNFLGIWSRGTGTAVERKTTTKVYVSNDYGLPITLVLDYTSSISSTSANPAIIGEYRHSRTFAPIEAEFCTGELGFYILTMLDDNVGIANTIDPTFMEEDTRPVSCGDWNMSPYVYDSVLGFPNMRDGFFGLSWGFVSFLNDIDPSVEPIPLPQCLLVNRVALAEKLGQAILPLRQKIFDEYHIVWSKKKPSTFIAKRRKSL